MDSHSKSDHEVERVQLQEDIERLQDTLQVHSDDEYIYDSDDDYLLIDLEHSVPEAERHDLNTEEDVSTRSSFDTKSPYTVQGSETPVDDAFTTLKTLLRKNLGGAVLPVCVESGLALNRAYQEVILNSLRKIQDALAQNRQKQCALEEDVEGGAPTKGPSNTKTLKVFMVPFFKDSSGACPPTNEDVYMKETLIKEPNVDPLALVPWHVNQKKKLKEGVKRDCLEKALKPLMTRRESLEICLKGIEAEKQDKNVIKKIVSIDAEINSIKKLTMSDLLDLVDETKIDWMKIAILDLSGNRSFESCKMMWQNVIHPHINRAPWQKTEEAKLVKLVKKYNFKEWETIAKQLATNRSPFQCLQHYQIYLNKNNRGKSSWSREEDELLKDVVEEIKSTGCRLMWEKVAVYVDGRSSTQCMTRWFQIDPSLNRGSWTEIEDAMLITAVELMGRADWGKIQQLVPGRSPAQCRERFCNCLDPKIYSGPWQYEEDKRLLRLVEKHGQGKWSNVVKELTGRTDNQALQRYNRLIKWKHLTEWFESLPESTKKAMLGKNLPVKEFKKLEKLTWATFQSQMGVFKEDYEKQRRDHDKGDLVVPRPPCVLGYTKSNAGVKVWKRRVAMQNLISLHIKKIRSQQVYDNKDPKELANMVAKMCTDDLQDQVANHVVRSLPGSLTVKSLIGISRTMTKCNSSSKKKKHGVPATRMNEHNKVKEHLHRVLHTLSAPVTKRSHRFGRPRKYFSVPEPLTKEQERKISVATKSFFSKALGMNTSQLLKTAALVANEQKKRPSGDFFDFEVANDVSTLTSICYGDSDLAEKRDVGDSDVSPVVDVDDNGDEVEDTSTSEHITRDGNDTWLSAVQSSVRLPETQSNERLATATVRSEQSCIVVDSDVEEVAENSTRDTTTTATAKCLNNVSVVDGVEDPSVNKHIGDKDLPMVQNIPVVESHLEIPNASMNKEISAKTLLTVQKDCCETMVNDRETENSPTAEENVGIITPNSNTKSTSVIILSTGKGSDITTHTASVKKVQENTSVNSEARSSVKKINKHVIVANNLCLNPESFKSRTGFQKPLFPRKTMSFKVNFGLQPRTGLHKILPLPTRPDSSELKLSNKRSLPSETIISQSHSSVDDNNSSTKIQCPKWGRITCRTLPPSVSTVRGFQMLLLKNKQMMVSANNFKSQCQEKRKKKLNIESEHGELTTESTDISRDEQDVDPLQFVRKTDKFQRLKSRFESIFLWPGLMATTSVPQVVDISEAAAPVVDDDDSLPSSSQTSNPAKPRSRKRKRCQQNSRIKSKKRKHEIVSNEDADGEKKQKRLGRPVGAKTCKQTRPDLPPRNSQRQTTQERKTYDDRLNRKLTLEEKRGSNIRPFNNRVRNSVFQLMKVYVKSQKMNQLQELTGQIKEDADYPMFEDEIEEQPMENQFLTEDAKPGLMENLEDEKLISAFSQQSVSHMAKPVSQMIAPVLQMDAPASQIAAPASQIIAPISEKDESVSQITVSETTSCVNVNTLNSSHTTELKTEYNIPAMNVSTFSNAILPSQTLNVESNCLPQSFQGLVPMILSLDKDSDGNIIQTLRPLSDLSQLPQNFHQNHEEIATVVSSDCQNEDAGE